MADAILRHLQLLRAIPRHPAKSDVTRLHRTLNAKGYRISRRQIQRDLETLSGRGGFPIHSDGERRGIARGWSWERGAEILDLPAMDQRTALMLNLLQRFTPQFLPPTLSDELRPYFRRAEETLKSADAAGLGRWIDCVRVVPREMPLLAPKLDVAATRVVYDALLMGKRFTAHYLSRSAGGKEWKEQEFNPLGLVARGNLLYLVCTYWNYGDPRHVPLQRMRHAKLLEKVATRPEGFDLDEYIRGGAFQYPSGEATGRTIVLKVIFHRGVRTHLEETPLSGDQVIKDLNDEEVLVTATVQDTQQLEWWLRAFGDGAEVVAPGTLRKRLKATLTRAAARYRRARRA
ncbi:MAG: helix-turn-helix transcriptional regulator [Steroidobacteraceae bacterium]